MEHSIELQNLKKNYNRFEAVKDISFSVRQGELFAFLGQNGAGKSTTVDMLCTLLPKTSGEAVLNGHQLGKDNDLIRRDIGVVFQKSLLDERLSVKENILSRGQFYGLSKSRLDENYAFVSKNLELQEIEKRKYGKLSGGQRRRADIARALIHQPKILFLDEPTTGLDPQTRIFVWETMKKLQKENHMTIFLTTHYMDEASVADHIIILDHGTIIAEGTPHDLRNKYAKDTLKIVFRSDGEELLRKDQLVYEMKEQIVSIPVKNTLEGLQLLKKWESYVESFEVLQGSMDDVFINVLDEKQSVK